MGTIITLTTDFGLKDPYQGAMKGAILSVNPDARLVDISHDVPPGDILTGAYILMEACRWYPPGTVHLAVVDPGVGSSRRPVVIETERYFFVGPDNGLVSEAARADRIKRVIIPENKDFFNNEISSTFHGRDVFGPVAAHLSLGVDPALIGPVVDSATVITLPAAEASAGAVSGEVIYIDSFGNIITNISGIRLLSDASPEDVTVEIEGTRIKGLKRSYFEAPDNDAIALVGSSGRVEIACNGLSAAELLRVSTGDKVTIRVALR